MLLASCAMGGIAVLKRLLKGFQAEMRHASTKQCIRELRIKGKRRIVILNGLLIAR